MRRTRLSRIRTPTVRGCRSSSRGALARMSLIRLLARSWSRMRRRLRMRMSLRRKSGTKTVVIASAQLLDAADAAVDPAAGAAATSKWRRLLLTRQAALPRLLRRQSKSSRLHRDVSAGRGATRARTTGRARRTSARTLMQMPIRMAMRARSSSKRKTRTPALPPRRAAAGSAAVRPASRRRVCRTGNRNLVLGRSGASWLERLGVPRGQRGAIRRSGQSKPRTGAGAAGRRVAAPRANGSCRGLVIVHVAV